MSINAITDGSERLYSQPQAPPSAPADRTAEPESDQASTSATATRSSPQARQNLSLLATMLGTDPETLLRQLSSGQAPSLSGVSAAGYGTSIADTIRGGVAFDEYA